MFSPPTLSQTYPKIDSSSITTASTRLATRGASTCSITSSKTEPEPGDAVTRDRCYDFQNTFAQFLAKKLAFFVQTTASFCKKMLRTLVFEANVNFSPKIAENCDHNVDPGSISSHRHIRNRIEKVFYANPCR
jgi:ATP-dependent exoDNAse (exonuclease V) beta subunit